MSELKAFIIGFFLNLLAYLEPVTGVMEALLAILFINFVCGLLAGYCAKNESFQWRKAFQCVVVGLVIAALICSLYFIGERQGNKEGTLVCVSLIMYLCDYIFACNILRNLKLIFRNQPLAYRLFDWLHQLLSIEFVKKFPQLKSYESNNQPSA